MDQNLKNSNSRNNDTFHVTFLDHSVGFPHGMASSTRLLLLAKGLVAQGAKVTVFIMQGTERPDMAHRNEEVKGDYMGVSFEYMTGTPVRPNNWWTRRWLNFRGFMSTALSLCRMKRADKLDMVIFYNRKLSVISLFSHLCRWLKVPTVLELCEWPLAQFAVHGKNRKRALNFCNKALRWVDGVVAISSYIEERVREYEHSKNRSLPVLQLPILVDIEQFRSKPNSNGQPYFVYCGSLNYYNILQVLIDATAELKRRSIECLIKILSGRSSEQDIEKLKAFASERDVADMVEIIPYLENDRLEAMYSGARALLAPLPDDLQSKSRFPTKIGEYLASGRPVLATAVGEVTRYLEDGITAYIADECTPESIADKAEEILTNPDRANKIGYAGRQIAKFQFNFSVHGSRLYNFLQKLYI